MSKQRPYSSARRMDVVSIDGLSDDFVSRVCRMREFGVRFFIFADLLGDLALHLLEVLGELLFGKFFSWWLHRTPPALVHPLVPGRDPWPTARLALLYR